MDRRGREGFGVRDAHVRRRGSFGPDEDTAYEEVRGYRKYFSTRDTTNLESQYNQRDGYDNGSYEPCYERHDPGGSSVIRRSDRYPDNGYGDRSHIEGYGSGIGRKDYCEDNWKSFQRKHRQSFEGDVYEDQRQYREDDRYGAQRNGISEKLREDENRGHKSVFYNQGYDNRRLTKEKAVTDVVSDWRPKVEVHSAGGEHGGYNYRQHGEHRPSRNRGQGDRSLSPDRYRADLYDGKELGDVDDKRVHTDYNYHPSKRNKVRDMEGRPGQAEESCSRYGDYSHDSGRMQSYGDYSREKSFGESRRPPPGTQLELCEQRMSRPRTPSFEDNCHSNECQNGRHGRDSGGYEEDGVDCYKHWSCAIQERRDTGDSLCYYERSAGDGGSLLDHSLERSFYNGCQSRSTTEGHSPENLSVQKEEGKPAQEGALRNSAEIADKPPAMRNSVAVPKRMPLTPATFAPDGETTQNLLDIPQCAGDPPVVLRRRGESLFPHGSQRFATMKNAKRIAEEMGMEEAKAEARAEVERAEEVLEDYAGRVQRTSWAKR